MSGATPSRAALPAIAVGGGLAGAAFALTLARAGQRVVVLERSRGPRHVVCGEFLSEEAAKPAAPNPQTEPVDARTPAPAITPVPSEAGRMNTLAASKRPRISWVTVVPCFGTVNRFFFASSTAFEIASGTSRALP